MDIIAEHRASKNFAQFWKITNNLNIKSSLPTAVSGCSTERDIANMFMEKFQVSSPVSQPRGVLDAGTGSGQEILRFSSKQVAAIIRKMSRGKSPGHDALSIEHLKYAGEHLPGVLAMFFSLYLHDAQFGFRPGLSTESAILCLKQTVQYYTKRQTPVYACFLDLSKAFDLVVYDVLWGKLEKAGVPRNLIEILKCWYMNQQNNVRWGRALSDAYRLKCGVRQGGLTSPKLFNLYVNELVVGLSSKPVRCHVDGICVNNISYADDMVLLGPTTGAIAELLRTCEQYTSSHGLVYNCAKSEFLIFGVPGKGMSYEPKISLNGLPLKRVDKFKYLGHYLTGDLKDQIDIDRERRALAARCNMLAHRFARCSEEAKITLFKAYCQSFYTGGLWVNYTQKALSALRVQYNNGFRMLMGLPRHCSASSMFALAGVDDFFAVMRNKKASLLSRLRSSSNSILKMFAAKLDAPMLQHFIQVLVRS
ncbi:uncharacterized protein LOC113231903 [Hyposmocoma kahamanoa]|uniref:uncharacterized protein LOC113231903 n=1 Tax=Hyposmocoma kahamanoa TaxID=1477025 RepID=UPI000E6D7118|nr:uncharacterized protein LOC113231903 [Hyposmocoma kahamanoa]